MEENKPQENNETLSADEALKQANAELQQKIRSLEDALAGWQNKAKVNAKDAADLTAKLEALREEMIENESKLQEAEQAKTRSDARYDSLRQDYASSMNRIEELDKQIVDLKHRNIKLERQNEEIAIDGRAKVVIGVISGFLFGAFVGVAAACRD